MVARALVSWYEGRAVVQFLKGEWNTGEIDFFKAPKNCQWKLCRPGFTLNTECVNQILLSSNQAWKKAEINARQTQALSNCS